MNLISSLIGPVSSLLEKVIEDKDKKNEIAFELATLADRQAQEVLKEQASIIRAEAGSEHTLAATWRPILMMVITFIVAMHYAVFPLANILFGVELGIELPPELWNLLNIGVGGYVVGRSGEKMVKEFKK